jgi:SAM-dependent methyltransferase
MLWAAALLAYERKTPEVMTSDSFCCPVCKGPLALRTTAFRCVPCGRGFPLVDGIPDFFISETNQNAVDEPNKTWLDPRIVEARDTIYRLSTRELKGMALCMQEVGRRSGVGCRILEVAMGTGHLTRWLAEVARPGTEIYAFDFSWPIVERAVANTKGLSGIRLFRANARGRLPFEDGHFDIVFLRLAPLGARGVPNVRAGYELLKPGGWYFEAGWEQTRYETAPTEWAIQHGYASAEHHEWQYWRTQTPQEQAATRIEQEHLAAQGGRAAHRIQRGKGGVDESRREEGPVRKLTHEHLLIAQKPGPLGNGQVPLSGED